MKKTVIFVFLAMVVIGFCAAQSANDAQKIVGTWVSGDGKTTVVYNANGTGTDTSGRETINFFWGVSASGEIALYDSTGENFNFIKFAMSLDGRRMFLYFGTKNIEMYQKK